jgi:hypothetical protein
MKYIHLLISSIALSLCSCSTFDNSKYESKSLELVKQSSLTGIPVDLLLYINSFLGIQDQYYMRDLNKFTRNALTLKRKVEQTFHISGLDNIDDNEPELAGVMRLAWTSHNPILFFVGLVEQVVAGKKPYNVLFRPLMLHLIKAYRSLDHDEKQKFLQYLRRRFQTSVGGYFAKVCATKGHLDLVFEIAMNDGQLSRDLFSNFKNRKELMEFLREKPHYARQYLDSILNIQDSMKKLSEIGIWIKECIISNLDQEYYISLFSGNPKSFEFIVTRLFLSTNVPESEYAKIYAQIVNIFDNYSGNMANTHNFAVLRMINDIRFGSFDLCIFQNFDFGSIDKGLQVVLVKAALLSNNERLFSDIFAKYQSVFGKKVIDQIVSFDELTVKDYQAKNFNVIFFMIQSNPQIFSFEDIFLIFVTKFYAIKHFKLENDLFIFEFAVSEHLSAFEFPQTLQIKSDFRSSDIFIENSLKHMKVFNENTVTTFIYDLIDYYKLCSKSRIINFASYEVIEMISKNPDLLSYMLENGIKLQLRTDNDTLEKYFDLPNFDLTNEVIEWPSLHQWKLTNLRTQDHLAKLERIEKKNVVESFLKWDQSTMSINYWFGRENFKLIYFEWRSVFAYWLKRYNGDRMIEIQTSDFVTLLNLDFPTETRNLFREEEY